MNPVTKAFIQLHLSILLAGWTGVFGKLISLSPGLIVFWRIVIAGGLIWLWAAATKKLDAVKKDRMSGETCRVVLLIKNRTEKEAFSNN